MSFLTTLFSSGAGNLVKSVGEAIDKVVTSDEERIALENEMQRAELDYKIQERALDVKETALYVEDLSSAREQQSRVQESENASWLSKNIQPFLALLVMCGTIFVFAHILFIGMGNTKESIVMMVLGALIAIATQIISYFFGASRSGDDHIMKAPLNEMLKKPQKP